MTIQQDIELYLEFLAGPDHAAQQDSQRQIIALGSGALLYLAAHLSQFRVPAPAPLVSGIFQTLRACDTPDAHHMLAFLAHSEHAASFWAPSICEQAATVLRTLADPPVANTPPTPEVVARFLIFLLGSPFPDEQQVAQRVLVNLADQVSWSHFTQALEPGSALTSAKQSRWWQPTPHPRPEFVLQTLQAINTQTSHAALLWIAEDRRGLYPPALQTQARTLADAMSEPRTTGQEADIVTLMTYRAQVAEADSRHCFVCHTLVKRAQWIEYQGAIFCSAACYQKAKRDHTYWM